MKVNKKIKFQLPTINFEKKVLSNNPFDVVLGVDEVGRGSWAGPLLACASFILPENFNDLPNIYDSKKMSKKNRRAIFNNAYNFSKYSICSVSVEEIEYFGINGANDLALLRAIFCLIKYIENKSDTNQNFIICVDGNRKPKFENFNKLYSIIQDKIKVKCFVKGDTKIISIALSSVLAKESRDIIMKRNHIIYPSYNFYKNVGYGTKEHRTQIEKFGITKLHRKNFKPINTIFSH